MNEAWRISRWNIRCKLAAGMWVEIQDGRSGYPWYRRWVLYGGAIGAMVALYGHFLLTDISPRYVERKRRKVSI